MLECMTHLRVLELPVDSSITAEELKKAFYRLALQWHPDRHEEAEKVTR